MQFFTERSVREQSFSKIAAAALGTLVIDTPGIYHSFKLSLLNGLRAIDFSEFRLKMNARAAWNVDGEFLDARHTWLVGETAEEAGQLVVDLKEPRRILEENRYNSSIPVTGVRNAAVVETLTLEARFADDTNGNADLDTRSIVGDLPRLENGAVPGPGLTRSIHSFPVDLRNGEVIVDQFIEGGIPSDRAILRRVWFKLASGHFKEIQVRDNADVRSEPTVSDIEREQEQIGFTLVDGWFVLDPVLDRSEIGWVLADYIKFNLRLIMGADGNNALPDSMTVYAEYDGDVI